MFLRQSASNFVAIIFIHSYPGTRVQRNLPEGRIAEFNHHLPDCSGSIGVISLFCRQGQHRLSSTRYHIIRAAGWCTCCTLHCGLQFHPPNTC